MLVFSAFFDPWIIGITERPLLVTMKQLFGGHNVVNVGGFGINAVDQAQRVIDTDVHLHAEMMVASTMLPL
jgi:hypothetical protein